MITEIATSEQRPQSPSALLAAKARRMAALDATTPIRPSSAEAAITAQLTARRWH